MGIEAESSLEGSRGVGRAGEEVEEKFHEQDKIPVPEFWGGLRVKPEMVEFWQGRPSRLHDRFRYTKDKGGEWKIDRLSP